MVKHTIIIILNLIQKVFIKINNYYKFIKFHILPPKTTIVNAFSSKTINLPSCYEMFKEEEMKKCYNHFKKHFFNSVFLDNIELQKYSIKEALINDNGSKQLYYLEFGVGRGTSINRFSDILQKNRKFIYGFDSFVGLREDWKGHVLYPKGSLSQNNKQPKVKKNVNLISGWIQDTLPIFLKEKNPKINFIHIDVDTYESTKFIFNNVKKYLANNCIILLDEMYNFPGWSVGEYKALAEEFAEDEYEFIAFSLNKGNAALKFKIKNYLSN